MGADVARDLATLQDQFPPFPSHVARRILEKAGVSLSKMCLHFDETPVAAASIAQVHFATLLDGRDVAIKILRPGIRHQN